MMGTQFLVDENPHACWDWELKEKNLEFLRGIDAGYFEYVAQCHFEHLDGDDKHRAALGIRIAYSQALETLFALLGAIVQAPTCPLGWMLAYRGELSEVVRKIDKGRPILNPTKSPVFTWNTLAAEVHERMDYPAEKKEWVKKGFAESWARFAFDFLRPHFNAEYNSMKHGLRARSGGFAIAVGTEETPGVQAPPSAMKVLGGSTFGASFFDRERIGKAGINFRPRRRNRNWIPESLAEAISLATMSITNVTSALRIIGGDEPTACQFRNPESPDLFDVPWATSVGVIDASMDTTIEEADISPQTKDDVRATFHRSAKS